MTPEERAAYEARRRAQKPGTLAERARRKADRQAREDLDAAAKRAAAREAALQATGSVEAPAAPPPAAPPVAPLPTTKRPGAGAALPPADALGQPRAEKPAPAPAPGRAGPIPDNRKEDDVTETYSPDGGEEEHIRRARRRIRTEGVPIALAAAIEIAQNPKAAASARTAAINALLRAGGLFGEQPEPPTNRPEDMSLDELRRRSDAADADYERAMAALAAAEAEAAAEPGFMD